jgi:histidine triad (HIT) family protein
LFCKIVAGEIPSNIVHQDDDVIAITDINPQAPHHLVVMPRKHFANVAELAGSGSPDLLAQLFSTAARIGREQDARGFRIVVNTGPLAGQTVDHVHVHVLAGRPMAWPPG